MQLDLGQKIRELRRRDGRTQEALAEAIGVTSQAVSRWEANGGYPDMEMIPAIANYFGVTIDELFGYETNRDKKIDALVKQIKEMNSRNNGVDINIDECLALARQAMIEFPANERIMLSLAEVLGYKQESGKWLDKNGLEVTGVLAALADTTIGNFNGDTINLNGSWEDGAAFELGNIDAFGDYNAWNDVTVNYGGSAVVYRFEEKDNKLVITKLA